MKRREADWVTVAEALERMLGDVAPLEPVALPIMDALGCVLAEPVDSPIDHPPWDNSAMDGFAVRAEDVRGASAAAPARLTVVEDVPAGAFPERRLGPGEAIRIMTGAPVPEGADGVIRIEHTDAWEAPVGTPPYPVAVLRDEDAGRNVRPRGEDLREGARVLEAGDEVVASVVGMLAALGRTRAAVHRRPVVAILSNGDELVEPDAFEAVLAGRRIVNSNSWGLGAAVLATSCEPRLLGIARDDVDSIREHLERALDADVLVTSAGAAVGDHDLMKGVLDEMGLELAFWRVKMKPGSPFSFGLLPRAGRRPLPVLGLPGNPVSALVTFEVLVRPVLRRLLGRRAVHAPSMVVRLAVDFPSGRGRAHYLRARLTADAEHGWLATPTGPQGSGILRSMVEADALVVVPHDVDGLKAGSRARAIPLHGVDPAAERPEFTELP